MKPSETRTCSISGIVPWKRKLSSLSLLPVRLFFEVRGQSGQTNAAIVPNLFRAVSEKAVAEHLKAFARASILAKMRVNFSSLLEIIKFSNARWDVRRALVPVSTYERDEEGQEMFSEGTPASFEAV